MVSISSKGGIVKKHFYILFIAILLASCGPSDSQIEEAIQKTNDTAAEMTASYISPTPEITFTPTVTKTVRPTITPKPTNTPTPKPEPIVIEGSGDDVVEIDKWDGPAIVDVVREGGGHFSITSYTSSSDYLELLVNVIAPYQGKVIMDLLTFEDEPASLLEINASGSWSISIYPFDRAYVNEMTAPGFYENNTDDVILVTGSSQTATFTATAHNLIVWGVSDNDIDLIVNEIGPYEGKVMIPNGLFLLVVNAESTWSVTFH